MLKYLQRFNDNYPLDVVDVVGQTMAASNIYYTPQCVDLENIWSSGSVQLSNNTVSFSAVPSGGDGRMAVSEIGKGMKIEARMRFPSGLSFSEDEHYIKHGFLIGRDTLSFVNHSGTLRTVPSTYSNLLEARVLCCYLEEYYGDPTTSHPPAIATWAVWINGRFVDAYSFRTGGSAKYLCVDLPECTTTEADAGRVTLSLHNVPHAVNYYSLGSGEPVRVGYETIMQDYFIKTRQENDGSAMVWNTPPAVLSLDLDQYKLKAPNEVEYYSRGSNRWRITGGIPDRDFGKIPGPQILSVYQLPNTEHLIRARKLFEETIYPLEMSALNRISASMHAHPLLQVGDIITWGSEQYEIVSINWQYGPQITANLELQIYVPA